MKTTTHPLPAATPGTSHVLTTLHFGPADTGRKVYIQAALHADETPAMLVAHVLRSKLLPLESEGRLNAEIVLAPMCNPLGVGQFLLGNFIGRFDLASGTNYNRGFPFVHEEVARKVEGLLGSDGPANVRTIRAAWRQALEVDPPVSPFDTLQRKLMLLAHDADLTLDLHCTREGPVHLYVGETLGDAFEPLARYLRTPAFMLEGEAGGQPFDEAQNVPWQRLQERFGDRFPIPHGNLAACVEHRGQRDVAMDLAGADAQALIDFMTRAGFVEGMAPEMPPLVAPATPLGGSEQFRAPISGILVHRVAVGSKVAVGDPLFDVIDPVDGTTVTVASSAEGHLYHRHDTRWVRAGEALGRVTGAVVVRTGRLLSA